ncbi:tRNA methyltransferase [Ceraceosorus bombacis]|uniref:tRNA (guanine(26)-N(2))-dimethyltransferase n=1 Tax=Ceraceosorus bombacis TaxID=401625 RepID=A0A0P1BAR3_9BASI|nr:tRNA methyltransferase [Ceraceosorus bombacis]
MAPTPVALSTSAAAALGISSDQSAFKEGSAVISIPKSDAAFLNPVQEFNRDLSVLAIRTWAERRDREKREKFEQAISKRKERSANGRGKRRKLAHTATSNAGNAVSLDAASSTSDIQADLSASAPSAAAAAGDLSTASTSPHAHIDSSYRPFTFNIFEALSATGLRSIRYAREIPNLKSVHANDLSPTAVQAIWKNVALNFPANRDIKQWAPELDQGEPEKDALEASSTAEAAAATARNTLSSEAASAQFANNGAANGAGHPAIHPNCKIHVTEQDAIEILYTSRAKDKQYSVIDLDPYGSASMFIDGAVQAVADGGLLCVTCTDLVVLAGNAYPERAYSLYGGTTTRNDFVHEVALRLVLGLIATTAGRYGRAITPLLSLSIDFYLRVFVSVQTRPVDVKMLASTMGTVQTCPDCGNWDANAFGRNKAEGRADLIKYQAGTSHAAGTNCQECESRFHVAGPMWLGPLHMPSFAEEMLEVLERAPVRFRTAPRIRGMVGMASKELSSPFFFIPPKISSYFHTTNIPLTTVVSCLLNAGYEASRSHAQPASIKTNASPTVVRDLWRQWVKEKSPINEKNVHENSPARRLLSKECATTFELDKDHPQTRRVLGLDQDGKKDAGVKYQLNPLPNWGPGKAARPESQKDRRRAAAAAAAAAAASNESNETGESRANGSGLAASAEVDASAQGDAQANNQATSMDEDELRNS